jgi:hypothetical protein
MSNLSPSLIERAEAYAIARGMQLKQELGHGKDGTVFSTDQFTAIKVYGRRHDHQRELDCYMRLYEHDVRQVLGHNVPQLLDADLNLLILEMTIVEPPFLLDFASAYLDWPPDFPPEVLEQWEQEKEEQFGRNWPRVRIILEVLKAQFDIYLFDVNPGNITFDEIA